MARTQTLVQLSDELPGTPRCLLTTRITSLPDARLAELCDALRAATAC